MYTLDKNENIALLSAMKLVLADWDNTVLPQIVVEAVYVGDDIANTSVSKLYSHLSNEDVYNLIWLFQETIYEAMCVSDFTNNIRSEFNK